jgi:hypothetical protein
LSRQFSGGTTPSNYKQLKTRIRMKHYVTLPGSFQETSNLQPALECNRIFRQKKKKEKNKKIPLP